MKTIMKLAVAVFVSTSGAAFADVTTVNCTDYSITISEADTIALQAVMGSGEAFDQAVCAAGDEQLEIKGYKKGENGKETLTDANGTEYEITVTKL